MLELEEKSPKADPIFAPEETTFKSDPLSVVDELEPQAGPEEAQGDQDDTQQPSAPVQKGVDSVMGTAPDDTDNSLFVYHGEAIKSFRSVLKRYTLVGITNLFGDADWSYRKRVMKHFPPIPGATINSSWGDDPNANFVQHTPMAYLAAAFGAARGGVRWKTNVLTTSDLVANIYLASQIEPELSTPLGYSEVPLFGAEIPEVYGSLLPPTFAGATYTPAYVNPVLEVEVPYQTQARFWTPRFVSNSPNNTDKLFSVSALCRSLGSGRSLMHHCAAAEDFSLHFYLSPPVYFELDE